MTEDLTRLLEQIATLPAGRYAAPMFAPYEDGWWLQNYNKKRFPALYLEKLKGLVPGGMQKILIKLLKRN